MAFEYHPSSDYPPDHFSLNNGSDGEEWFVCALSVSMGSPLEETKSYNQCLTSDPKTMTDPVFMIKVNMNDSRGFRTIVRLVTANRTDMKSTLNRSYSLLEKQGLGLVSALVSHVYEKCFGLIPQVEILGNRAHGLEDGKIVLGSKSEPLMLHSHCYGRGDPEHAYITELPHVKLGGPRPGENFDLRGDVCIESGTVTWRKRPWYPQMSSCDVKKFSSILASHLRDVVEKQGCNKFKFITPFNVKSLL